MSLATISTTSHFVTPFVNDDDDDDMPDFNAFQSISGRNIDPSKLLSLLRMKFGAGTYDMHIVQNSYCVVAPRKLSTGEIAQCRRRSR